MNGFAFVLLLPLSGADPTTAPEVQGLLATRITFAGESRAKLAGAVLDLLSTCVHSEAANEDDWLAAQRLCHVHILFLEPRRSP
jgi:hypothetical protein